MTYGSWWLPEGGTYKHQPPPLAYLCPLVTVQTGGSARRCWTSLFSVYADLKYRYGSISLFSLAASARPPDPPPGTTRWSILLQAAALCTVHCCSCSLMSLHDASCDALSPSRHSSIGTQPSPSPAFLCLDVWLALVPGSARHGHID